MIVTPRAILSGAVATVLSLLGTSLTSHAATISITSFEESVQPYNGGNSTVTVTPVNSPVHDGSWALQAANNINTYGGAAELLSGDRADWTGATSISMWVYGNGSAPPFYVIVEDAQHEQLWAPVSVNWTGWQQVTLPISSFVSRTDWQPPGAVVNGSIQSPVVSFHFYSYPTAAGNRTATFTFDQIELHTPLLTKLLTGFEESVQAYTGSNSTVTATPVNSPLHDGSWALRTTNNITTYGGAAELLSGERADWSSATSVSMWINATGWAPTFWVIVEDAQHEQLWAPVSVNWSGWAQATIPITSFVTRSDWQPAGAIVNGTIQSPVVSFHFYSYPNASGTRNPTFTFDQIALNVTDTQAVTQGNGNVVTVAVSADGRYLAFGSLSSNLVPNDTNAASDAFVLDRGTGQTTRVSVRSDGTQSAPGKESYPYAISADGRYVFFHSADITLVPGGTNHFSDSFVHDRVTHQTTRLLDGAGVNPNQQYEASAITPDARYVVFDGYATNVVPNDTNGHSDVFMLDRTLNTIKRISVSAGGGESNGDSSAGNISADGRYVTFWSDATNLVAGDTNGVGDCFVFDNVTNTTRLVSVSSAGIQGNSGSYRSRISADGRYVVYRSFASNLVSGDTNGTFDIFLFDRTTSTNTLVSVSSSGTQADRASDGAVISGDGKRIFFITDATNLVSGDTNGIQDLFVRNTQTNQTSRLSLTYTGAQANGAPDWLLGAPAVTADAALLFYISSASNLVPNDTNGKNDAFLVRLK